MPREEYQSISIPLSVYERATQVKNEHDLTWGDLLERAMSAPNAPRGVRVEEITEDALNDLSARLTRDVCEELQRGSQL